jgi:ABC-type phosphate transport system substrate-binding protein
MRRTATLVFALVLAIGAPAQARAGDIVVVVSARNAVTALDHRQVEDIFLGRIRRFPDGAPVAPIDLSDGSALRDSFYLQFLNMTPAQMRAHWSRILFTGRGQPPTEAASTAELKRRIAEDPAAIGYMDRAEVDARLRIVATP